MAGTKIHFAHDALVYYRYRTSFRDIYEQAKKYGKGDAVMYSRYASLLGVSKPTSRSWARILGDLVTRTSTRGDLAKLLFEVGKKVGTLDRCPRVQD
jgi:hypothetical protein